ncbi:MAG: hypothetical protein MOGMAGMI_00107 [Candidatus Omnitrophica bacterium]|nr:hypothetical protein [Candidatus Omnitrophota bacterium]
MKLPVLFVHGIGGSDERWAEPIIARLERKVLAELRAILRQRAPHRASEVLVCRSVYWKTALEEPQRSLQRILTAYLGAVRAALSPIEAVFRAVLKRVHKLQSTVVPLFIGDIIGYLAVEGKLGVEKRFTEALDALLTDARGKDVPLTIVSHSLGTVVTSNYIYDRMSEHRARGINRMDTRYILHNLYTAGSPLALFSMKFGGPEHFDRPVSVEHPRGLWINVIDKDDPVSMPLRPLNTAYAHAVHADYAVDSGWNWGDAHMRYFERTDTLDIIARKLAIDWVACNASLPAADIERLYRDYDQRIARRSG